MQLFNHPLNPSELIKQASQNASANNLGAFVSFIGLVRDEINEDGLQVSGLSFDINKPLLESWFNKYQSQTSSELRFYFAHSIGDVAAGECSYFAAIASYKRELALSLLSDFVEDFKHNAPIWKYDLIKGERVYAAKRSNTLQHSGILAL